MQKIGHEDAGPLGTFRDEVVRTDAAGDAVIKSLGRSRHSGGFSASGSPFFDVPRQPVTLGMAERSRRRETLALAGRTLDCTVLEYTSLETTPNREAALTLWRADSVDLPAWDIVCMNGRRSLPHDVVRATYKGRQGTNLVEVALDVDAFHSTITVGGTDVDCVVGKMSSVATNGNGRTALRSWRVWLSAEIPGGIARRERQCTGSPTAVPYDYTIRDEVTSFRAIR
jgi:hypothetical protein